MEGENGSGRSHRCCAMKGRNQKLETCASKTAARSSSCIARVQGRPYAERRPSSPYSQSSGGVLRPVGIGMDLS